MIETSERPIIGLTARTIALADGATAYGVNQAYITAVHEFGGVPLLLPPGNPDAVQEALLLLDGLLLPGGGDIAPELYGETAHPAVQGVDHALDALEMNVIPIAYEADIPILAICRGVQSLTVSLGGSLIQDLPSERASAAHEVREFGRDHRAHAISIEPGSTLATALGTTEVHVNTLHHQAIRSLPHALEATAWSEDGVIEAAEAPAKRFVVGLQCHPEELWATTGPEFAALFGAFIAACQEYRAVRLGVTLPASGKN